MKWIPHIIMMFLFGAGLSGCDTVEPSREGTLVLEAYVQAGKPLPTVRITRTSNTSVRISSVSNAVNDADVELTIDDTTVRYVAVPNSEGLFQPEPSSPTVVVQAFSEFLLDVHAGDDHAICSC